jgi:4'-phosphopantetheinyl transferase
MIGNSDLWQVPPDDLALAGEDVHIWRAPLDLEPNRVAVLRRYLSKDEIGRIDRFHFAHLRAHATVSRGLLRVLLGRYLQVEPEEVRFGYNGYGHPSLVAPATAHSLRFNVAHSGSLVLYAFALARSVGIDIERIQVALDYERIAASTFSPLENELLGALPANQRREAFFHCWVRKEAYIKAHGLGLSMPLDRFAVTLAPDEPAKLLHAEGEDAAIWSLQELAPAPGYAAAAAIEGQSWRLGRVRKP